MKITINEQQLTNLILNSTNKILKEAEEDEGLGRFLGNIVGRIRRGINKFKDDFTIARNKQQYQGRDYDAIQHYDYEPEMKNFNPNMYRRYHTIHNSDVPKNNPQILKKINKNK